MNQSALYFGDDACVVDPFKANRTYFLSGKGTAGNRPGTDDTGTVILQYGNANPAATGLYSTAAPYWQDYKTSLYMPYGWLRIQPSYQVNNTLPFKNMWDRSPFSWLSRCIFGYRGDNSAHVIRGIAQGTGGWGGSGRMELFYIAPTNSTQGQLVYQFATETGPTYSQIASPVMTVFGVPLEILLTRDASYNTRLFINGALIGTVNAQPSAAQFWNEQNIGIAADVYGGGDFTMSLTDDAFYSVCIASAAYTPATQPFC